MTLLQPGFGVPRRQVRHPKEDFVRCAGCDRENRPGRKFCAGCGAPLAVPCPACGTANEPDESFCGECGTAITAAAPSPHAATSGGPAPVPDLRAPAPRHLAEKIRQARASIEGERKQVTVLFADVKGSMDLAEQLDPEEWSAIMQRFFAILCEGVERFEGFVDKFTGDGIMALFGAPIAHEDHAQRACYAALHLRDALGRLADELRRTHGVSLSTRIGINSGEVVVGTIRQHGDDLRMDYTAQGHTVGLAQRMESCAAADRTYLTAHTARLVEGYFQLRDLGDFDVKGVSAPLRAYELQGVGSLRTRLDASRARGFSKFVGRDREMATLEGALDAAIAGNGQVVGVVADAGTGKSRLCLEFVARCRARGIRVNEGHCPAHGRTIPHLPLLEMLRDIFGITERDGDHEARRKIAGELLLLDDAFQDLLPILFDFMGVPDATRQTPEISPEGRQQKLLAFVRHLSEARSAREPTVLFLDDVHWIDPGSDVFLAHSIAAVPSTRTLWLVNFRPEYAAEWMRKPYYQQIPLQPFGAEATRELLGDLLGSDPSVAGLSAYVHRRTGGNPFFIEEVVQSLLESGRLTGAPGAHRLVGAIEDVEIPSTVQTVLAARIDRLGDDAKRTLQTASVIGKEFSGAILSAVAVADERDALSSPRLAAALDALRAGEFVHETALYPEVEYAFKHPLTQEVAYRSQLGARRAQVHAAVARAIEQLHADKLDERAALLAYHWEQAGEALVAAQWYARSARVAGFDSPVEAVRHWEKVWEILASAPPSDAGVTLRREAATQLLLFGWRLGMSGERVSEIFAAGNQLARAAGDVREQVCLHYSFALFHALDGDPRRSFPIFEAGVAMADATGEPELRWSARTGFDFALWMAGDLAAAERMNDEQIVLADISPALGLATVGLSTADSLWHRAVILTDLGRFAEAAAALRGAHERARSFGENDLASWVDFWWAHLFSRMGEVPDALSMARRAIESTEKIGSALGRVNAYGQHGLACVLAGEWQSADESFDRALDLGRANPAARFLDADFVAGLAEAQLGLRDGTRARAFAEQAIEIAAAGRRSVGEVHAQLALARVLRGVEGADASAGITAALDRADALVQTTGARSYAPQILVERARLATLHGDTEAAQRRLHEAHRLFTDMGATGHARRLAEDPSRRERRP